MRKDGGGGTGRQMAVRGLWFVVCGSWLRRTGRYLALVGGGMMSRDSAWVAMFSDAGQQQIARRRACPSVGNCHLSAHGLISAGGAVRNHLADAPRGGVNRFEHRRGMRPPWQSRAAFVPLLR